MFVGGRSADDLQVFWQMRERWQTTTRRVHGRLPVNGLITIKDDTEWGISGRICRGSLSNLGF